MKFIVKWTSDTFWLEVIVYHCDSDAIFQKGIKHHCACFLNVYVKMGMEFAVYLPQEERCVGKGTC